MTQPQEPPKIGGPRASAAARFLRPQVLVPAVLAGFSLLFYLILSRGLRAPEAEGFAAEGAGGPQPITGTGGAAAGALGKEMEFVRGRDELARQAARNDAKLAARYGQSSADLMRGSAALAPKLFDDVAKGVGNTIRGILRPSEARKRSEAIPLGNAEMESALRQTVPSGTIAGGRSSAGRARSLAAGEDAPRLRTIEGEGGQAAGGAESSSARTAARIEGPGASQSGLRITADGTVPEREMVALPRGGFDGTSSPRAVNTGSGQPQQVLAQTAVTSLGAPVADSAALPTSATRGRIQEFKPNEGVKAAAGEVTVAGNEKREMAKLTAAQVNSAAGKARKGTEAGLELGGVVYDGKRPTGGAVSGPEEPVGGTNPQANKLLSEEAGRLERDVMECEKLSREGTDGSRTLLRDLKEKGSQLREKVRECRDVAWGCNAVWSSYQKCSNPNPKPKNFKPCKKDPFVKKIDNIMTSFGQCAASLKADLALPAEGLCVKFVKQADDKMKGCKIVNTEAVTYGTAKDCKKQFVEDPLFQTYAFKKPEGDSQKSWLYCEGRVKAVKKP